MRLMRKTIGQFKVDQRIKNTNTIFETLCRLGGEATLSQVANRLARQIKQHNKIISTEVEKKYQGGEISKSEMEEEIKRRSLKLIANKTIQRCAKEDPRIEWDGIKYCVTSKVRLELRDLDPEFSGIQIFRETINFVPKEDIAENISSCVQRFGAFIFFTFIEASRPTGETYSSNEKNELVKYWYRNATPLDDMFNVFRANFGSMKKYTNGIPRYEMDIEDIDLLLEGINRKFPDIYKSLVSARKTAFSKKGMV